MNRFSTWLDHNKDLGVFFLRLFIGLRLIYGVVDNVVSWEHMLKFRDFLHLFNFPLPLLSAIVSVYAQLLAGVLIVVGWKIRWVSILLIINFLVAIFMVHRADTFEQMTPALMMIFCGLLFLFYGAGKYSVDYWQNKKAGIKR